MRFGHRAITAPAARPTPALRNAQRADSATAAVVTPHRNAWTMPTTPAIQYSAPREYSTL